MSDRKLTLEIYPSECVGDSVGKHNYNTLSLDTIQCNLSSLFFEGTDNLFTDFQNLSTLISNVQQLVPLYQNPFKLNSIYTTVNLLSSYWERQEFSVYYPLNLSVLNNRSINAPVIGTPDEVLVSLAKNYLDKNFPAIDYNDNAIVNVNIFLYSNNNKQAITTTVSQEFSYYNRVMNASLTKQSIHFSQSKIFKYINSDGNWEYIGKISDWTINSSPQNFEPEFPDLTPTSTVLTTSEGVEVAEITARRVKKIGEVRMKKNNANVLYFKNQSLPAGSYSIRYKTGAYWSYKIPLNNYGIGSFLISPGNVFGGVSITEKYFNAERTSKNVRDYGLNYFGANQRYYINFVHPGGKIGISFPDAALVSNIKNSTLPAPKIGYPVWELYQII